MPVKDKVRVVEAILLDGVLTKLVVEQEDHVVSEIDLSDPSGVIATQINAAVANLVDSSPGALNTLNELAAALGDDANFASTITTALAGKQNVIPNDTYAEPPLASDGVFYVSAIGNDSNSGLSHGKAKATIDAAIIDGARHIIAGKGTFFSAALTTAMGGLTVDGVGPGETILDFSTLTGTAVAFDFRAGGPASSNRPGPTLNNLTIKGPGILSATTGIKPYSGFAGRNLEVILFGVGIDLDGVVGVDLDRSVEIRGCGVGFKTSADSNQNHIGARVLGCIKGCIADSNQVVVEAWFEGCTSTEIEIRDCNSIHFRGMWIEHGRTDPSIIFRPDAPSYAVPLMVSFTDSYITQAGGTHFMEVDQCISLITDGLRINDSGYAAIKVVKWLSGFQDRGSYVATSDTETDKSVRVPLRIIGPGMVYSVDMPRDLANKPFDPSDERPWIGGFANAASINLLSDSSFEAALNATGNGASAPIVTDDVDAYYGSHSCKAVFLSATAGTAGYLRIDRSFSAISGQWYVLQFMAKANKAFRGITFRTFNVTSGAFETLTLPFLDLDTTYRRHTILWQAPATGNFRFCFYKQTTTNDISLWVDDVAVWSGSVPGIYLPGRVTTVPKGAVAADSLVMSGNIEVKRVQGAVGAVAYTTANFVLHANWGTTASITNLVMTDQGGTFWINAGGTGQGADPTVVITFLTPFAVAPIPIVKRNGGNGTTEYIDAAATTTTLTFKLNGTPLAGGNYKTVIALL